MPFETLPGNARLWLLGLRTPPDPAAADALARGLAELIAQWRHKGQIYRGEAALLEPQLLAVAEPTLAAQPSGCAIDGMLRRVRRLVEDRGLELVDPVQELLVRLEDRLVAVPKADLPARLADGTLDAATRCLDLSLYNLEDLRSGLLEQPLSATWVARRFHLDQPA
jgi:hypothetical protein